MTKKTLIIIFGCVLLTFYLIVAVGWSRFSARTEKCRGLENGRIEVVDPDDVGFVTSEELTHELIASLGDSLTEMSYDALDLSNLQKHLNSLDKIERAEVVRLSDDHLRIRVYPMEPVARIWTNGKSYYVNREGKTIAASSKYRIDVPQVIGRFDSLYSTTRLLPLLDNLSKRPDFERIITMINATDSANILLVPAVRGHIINLGNPDNINDKLNRLQTFYRKVLPVKGWNHYDTISLKWDGQIVATRRNGKLPDLSVKIIEELENEADDASTMSTSTVADISQP